MIKRSAKVIFITIKNKKLSKIDETDVDKTLVFKKKNHMVQKIHLNASLDIVMMVLFDHYV